MGVRRTINRYRETPSGYKYDDVLKRGKAFHRNSLIFEMVPFNGDHSKAILWTAEFQILPPFKRPEGTRTYKFDIKRKRWIEITEQED